ncbi:hypothetical protein, partial [Bacillus thuringiensis]|uniref:hypothetical protein n=2 Tax=Bacillus TaxID=1386 RepID=UPI001A8CE45E
QQKVILWKRIPGYDPFLHVSRLNPIRINFSLMGKYKGMNLKFDSRCKDLDEFFTFIFGKEF